MNERFSGGPEGPRWISGEQRGLASPDDARTTVAVVRLEMSEEEEQEEDVEQEEDGDEEEEDDEQEEDEEEEDEE